MGIRKKGVAADNWLVRLHSVKTRGQSAARNLTLLLPSNSQGKSRSNAGTILRTRIFVARILFFILYFVRERLRFRIYYLLSRVEIYNIPVHSTILKRK